MVWTNLFLHCRICWIRRLKLRGLLYVTRSRTFIMNSVNLENYIWIYVYEDGWEQDGVLLETYSLRILDSLLNTLFGEGLINFGMVLLKVPSISVSQYLKVSEFLRLGSSLFHSMIVAGKKVFLKLRLVLNSEILAWFLICVAIVSFFLHFLDLHR